MAAAVARRRTPTPAGPTADPPPLPRRRTEPLPAAGEATPVPAPTAAELTVAPGAVDGAPTNRHAPPAVVDGDPDTRFETAAHLLADLAAPPADVPRPRPEPARPARPNARLRARPEAGPLLLPPAPPDPRLAPDDSAPGPTGHDRALDRGTVNGNGGSPVAEPAPLPPPPSPAEAPGPARDELYPPPGPPLPPLPVPAEDERPRWPLMAGGAVALVVVVGLLVTVLGGGGADGAADSTGGSGVDTAAPDPDPTTTTVAVDLATLPPTEAAALAVDRLLAAGTFRYQGASLATDVSPVRPGMWLTVELTNTGEVDLTTGELHDVGVTDDGRATETVSDSTVVWGRLADSAELLPDVGFLTIGEPTEEPVPTGALLLPTWIESATTVEDLPDDGSGRRHLRVVVPADVVGVVEGGAAAVDAEMILSLDAVSGDPVRIEIRTIDGPPLLLALDLTLGVPVEIDVPDLPTDDTGTEGVGR